MKQNKELNNAIDGIKTITSLCNDIEKKLLIESVKNKNLIKTKNDIGTLKDLLVDVFENIIKSDIIDMEVAILYDNEIYLGVIDKNYIIYNKQKNNDEIDILGKRNNLEDAIALFYKYAYKKKLKKVK